VRLHRPGAQTESLTDLPIRKPLGHQPQHLKFSIGEYVRSRWLIEKLSLGAEYGHQPAGYGGLQHNSSLGDGQHGVDEFVVMNILEQVSGGPGSDRLEHVLVVVVDGEDEDVDIRPPRLDLPGGLNTAQTRQAKVHQDHVWPELASEAYRISAIGGLAHDLDLSTVLQDLASSPTNEGVIINDENAGNHGDGHLPRVSVAIAALLGN